MTTFDPWSTKPSRSPSGSATPLLIGGGAAIGIIAIVALIAAFAWPRGPEPKPVACGVVVDSTSFGKLKIKGENYEQEMIRRLLPRVLEKAGCQDVRFSVVQGSLSTPCLPEDVSIEPAEDLVPTQRKQYEETQRQRIVSSALRLTSASGDSPCAPDQVDDPDGSAVVDALREIADKDKAPLSTLVLFSDLDENKAFKLTTKNVIRPGWRKSVIADLKERDRLPVLGGTAVKLCGIGVGIDQASQRLAEFKAFWHELLAASGNPDVNSCEA